MFLLNFFLFSPSSSDAQGVVMKSRLNLAMQMRWCRVCVCVCVYIYNSMWVYGPRHVSSSSPWVWMNGRYKECHTQATAHQTGIYLFIFHISFYSSSSFLRSQNNNNKKKREEKKGIEKNIHILFLWLGISPCAGWWASAKFACSGIKRKEKPFLSGCCCSCCSVSLKEKDKRWRGGRRLYVGFYFYEWERGTHRSVSFQEARALTERIE